MIRVPWWTIAAVLVGGFVLFIIWAVIDLLTYLRGYEAGAQHQNLLTKAGW